MKRTVLLSVLLTIIVICGVLPAGCHRGLSHQPSTINQMKLLVTPQDQTVTQALQEALATPDKSISYTSSSTIADINKMRLWVFSNIKQTSDEALHGVNDYWQTPTETLALKAGDCEDFAILMVSMMRAYGVPKDQVYVAVGDDVNKNWHAFVVERYSYGEWVEFDPENLDDATLLSDILALKYYDISYCFNDQEGFNATPVYPPGYIIPTADILPVIPNHKPISISDISSHNKSLDDAKQRLGELWLTTYLPPDYFFSSGSAVHVNSGSQDNGWYLILTFLSQPNYKLMVSETNDNDIGELQSSFFQTGTAEQITINNQPAYLGLIPSSTSFGSSNTLVLYFVQGGLHISLSGTPGGAFTKEELIKIAESLEEY